MPPARLFVVNALGIFPLIPGCVLLCGCVACSVFAVRKLGRCTPPEKIWQGGRDQPSQVHTHSWRHCPCPEGPKPGSCTCQGVLLGHTLSVLGGELGLFGELSPYFRFDFATVHSPFSARRPTDTVHRSQEVRIQASHTWCLKETTIVTPITRFVKAAVLALEPVALLPSPSTHFCRICPLTRTRAAQMLRCRWLSARSAQPPLLGVLAFPKKRKLRNGSAL